MLKIKQVAMYQSRAAAARIVRFESSLPIAFRRLLVGMYFSNINNVIFLKYNIIFAYGFISIKLLLGRQARPEG